MKSKKKPHIIILNPDEMRMDSMGHMGNQSAKTPYLDRFAQEEAVSFRSAYCQNPVCVPSRCSFLTGQYPHVKGHRTMNYLLHEDESSLFMELKEAGYYVWMNSRNDLVAGQIVGLAESHASEIYYYDKNSNNPVTAKSLSQRAAMLHNTLSQSGDAGKFPYSHFHGLLSGPNEGDMNDTLAAVDRILHPVDERPLCLFLGWTNPHPPYQAEEPYFSSIERPVSWPRVRREETSGKSNMIYSLQEHAEMEEYSEEQWAEMRAVYLAQCAKVDTMFHMVCEALMQTGQYDDSAIFVLSDHGDFCGDFDLPEKAQNTFEDCLTRVPLLIKPPKGVHVDPGVTDSLAELLDFYATAMDYAEVKPSHDHFGRSLRSVVADRTQKVRDFVCCEGGRLPHEEHCDEAHVDGESSLLDAYAYRRKAQMDALAHEKGTMICDGHYKYVHRPSGSNEFYDLQKDPGERNNIYETMRRSPELLGLKEELLDWYQQTCDIVPYQYDNRFTEERIWASVRNFCLPEKEDEVREYIRRENLSIMEAIPYALKLSMKK